MSMSKGAANGMTGQSVNLINVIIRQFPMTVHFTNKECTGKKKEKKKGVTMYIEYVLGTNNLV